MSQVSWALLGRAAPATGAIGPFGFHGYVNNRICVLCAEITLISARTRFSGQVLPNRIVPHSCRADDMWFLAGRTAGRTQLPSSPVPDSGHSGLGSPVPDSRHSGLSSPVPDSSRPGSAPRSLTAAGLSSPVTDSGRPDSALRSLTAAGLSSPVPDSGRPDSAPRSLTAAGRTQLPSP